MNLTTRRLISGFALLAVLLFCTPALAFNPVPAQPVRAIFYPGEIEVFVEERRKPEELLIGGTGFLLVLPPRVVPESFLVSVDGGNIGGYYWLDSDARAALLAQARMPPRRATMPENEPSPERRALLEKLIPLDEEVTVTTGALAAAQARVALWEKSLERFGQQGNDAALGQVSLVDEAIKLNEVFTRQFPDLYLEHGRQLRALEDAQVRLAKAVQLLEEFDHRENYSFVTVPFNGSATDASEVIVRYSYAMPGSSALQYRLGAFPDRGEIVVAQDVSLTQRSGFAWADVEVFVSTIRRDRTLEPTNIQPWYISLRENRPQPASPPPRQRAATQEVFAVMGEAPAETSIAEARVQGLTPAPVVEERGTFRIWNLGKRRIEHKIPVTLVLASDTYEASFLYTLRPLNTPIGFLTASLSLPQALELPPGVARFSVDDAFIGSRQFSFNGTTGEIFFGSDPQVTAIVRDLQRTGGTQGFFSREQTLLWHWQITIRNTRNRAVAIVLEDPAPVVDDSAISIRATSTPRPENIVNATEHGGASIYRWQASLKPGELFVVDHKVEVSAPSSQDRVLDPGYRRR
jgi:hypothetical protein